MRICAVPGCGNDAIRRPDLYYFNLPKDSCLRSEWLDVLGTKHGESAYLLKVCEVHFRPKDFVSGKKQLKTHAIPVLKLGQGKAEPVDSDDEFACNSDSDPEIIEIKKISAFGTESNISFNVKEEPVDTKSETEMETPLEMEIETPRRPSRRAAQVAAQKIYNSVHNLSVGAGSDNLLSPSSAGSRSNTRSYQRQRQRFTPLRVTSTELDVVLECSEDILSAVQAEALLKSQIEYNMVMKTLRSLKASNVNIICQTEDDQPAEILEPAVALSPLNITFQNGNTIVQPSRKLPNIVTVTPIRAENSSILPTELSSI